MSWDGEEETETSVCRSGERGHKISMDCGATSVEAGRKLQAEVGRLQPVACGPGVGRYLFTALELRMVVMFLMVL